MYNPPAYVWAITIAGPTAIAALACVVLYGGADRAGLGRRRAALLAGAAAVVLGGWFVASAVIAGSGWYRSLPWLPVAAGGFLGILLALSRISLVARALAAPGTASRLVGLHTFRVTGVFFLFYLALGQLPALFALPAGLGDITAGVAASLVALRLSRGTGRRAALWFNALGMTELAVAVALGALTGFQLLNITPSSNPISELPLALIPTADVPLLLVLHITSMLSSSGRHGQRHQPSGSLLPRGRHPSCPERPPHMTETEGEHIMIAADRSVTNVATERLRPATWFAGASASSAYSRQEHGLEHQRICR